jgi:hypothetical protein
MLIFNLLPSSPWRRRYNVVAEPLHFSRRQTLHGYLSSMEESGEL